MYDYKDVRHENFRVVEGCVTFPTVGRIENFPFVRIGLDFYLLLDVLNDCKFCSIQGFVAPNVSYPESADGGAGDAENPKA